MSQSLPAKTAFLGLIDWRARPFVSHSLSAGNDKPLTWSEPVPLLSNEAFRCEGGFTLLRAAGNLYAILTGRGGNLHVASSEDGTVWELAKAPIGEGFKTFSAPASAAAGTALYIGASGADLRPYLLSSDSDFGNPGAPLFGGQIVSFLRPTLAEFDGRLCIGMVDISRGAWLGMLDMSSGKPVWSGPFRLPFPRPTIFPLALQSDGEALAVASIGTDGGIYLTSTANPADPEAWNPVDHPFGPQLRVGQPPVLGMLDKTLVLAYATLNARIQIAARIPGWPTTEPLPKWPAMQPFCFLGY